MCRRIIACALVLLIGTAIVPWSASATEPPSPAASPVPSPTDSPIAPPERRSNTSPTELVEGHVSVDSRLGWHETSLFAWTGDQFTVTYISGTWNVDYRSFPYVGPAGYELDVDQQIYQGCKLDPQLPYGVLIGRFIDWAGESSVIPIGPGGIFTAPADGWLSLSIHDNPGCAEDNDGAVIVELSGGDTIPPYLDLDVHYVRGDNGWYIEYSESVDTCIDYDSSGELHSAAESGDNDAGDTDGEHDAEAYCIDYAGNITSYQKHLWIDGTLPNCETVDSGTTASGQTYIDVLVEDATSGLRTIDDVGSSNVTLTRPALPLDDMYGPSNALVRATLTDPSSPGKVALRVSDVAGNDTGCGPIAIEGVHPLVMSINADDPAGYWRFTESSGPSLKDGSGNGNHASIKGTVVLGASGALTDSSEPGVRFDSGGDYLSVPDSASLSPTRVTIEAWVKLDAYTGFYPFIVNKPSAYYLNVADGTEAPAGTLFFRVYTPTAKTVNTVAADALQLGQWYHVVATYDGTTARIVVNGAERARLSVTGNLVDSTGALTLGTSSRLLSGTLDEVAIYDHVLSPERILAHYTASGRETPPIHRLSVSKTGNGSGTITSSVAGIDCGSDCSESYINQTRVVLTAMTSDGATFGGWGGACTGTVLTCTVVMSEIRNVTATFTIPTAKSLSVTKDGTGRGTVVSTPSGINCGTTCSKTYTTTTTVTLKASPVSGSTFSGWSGGCSGTALTCTVVVDQVKTVTANFTDPSRPVRITGKVLMDGSAVPNVTVSITCKPISGSSCLAAAESKTLLDGSFVIHGAPGAYDLYVVPATGVNSLQTTLVNAITAGTYANQVLAVGTVIAMNGTTEDPTTSSPVAGVKLTVTIPRQGAAGTVTLASVTSGADGSYSLRLTPGSYSLVRSKSGYPTQPVIMFEISGPTSGTIIAIYPSVALTVMKQGTGTGIVKSTPNGINCGSSCTKAFSYGTSMTLTANPSSGSRFTGWLVNGSATTCPGTGSCTIHLTAVTDVTATFAKP